MTLGYFVKQISVSLSSPSIPLWAWLVLLMAAPAFDSPVIIQSTIAGIQLRAPLRPSSAEDRNSSSEGCLTSAEDNVCCLGEGPRSPGIPLIPTINRLGTERSCGHGKAQPAGASGELMNYHPRGDQEAASRICSTCSCSRRSRFCLRRLLLVFSNLSILWLSLRGEESISSS